MDFSLEDIMNYEILALKKVHFSVEDGVVIAIIIVLTTLILRFIRKFIQKKMAESVHDRAAYSEISRYNSIYQIIRYIVIIIAASYCLEIIGIKLTFLLAGSAALLVGVGLGVQEIFKDIVSGFFLLFEGTAKVGDVIETEGIIARVKEINLRTSKVVTRDNVMIIIPNHYMISEKVINWSHHRELTRFNIFVNIAYGTNTDLARKVLTDCLLSHESVAKDEKHHPFVRLSDFGEFAIRMELLFWSPNSFRIENIKSDIRFEIEKRFRENGIEIPFPQRVVQIRKPE